MTENNLKWVQRFRASLYLLGLLAVSLSFILSLVSCEKNTPSRGEWVINKPYCPIESLSRGCPIGPPWPYPSEPEGVNLAFWPPDMIPHPHLPSPPKKDDMA